MNIVNKVTIRHLKENKRRTLVTIIGVIISVAMITAVATLGVSFLDLMIRQHIAFKGEWHVEYENVNPTQLEVIDKDEATKQLLLSNNLGYAYLEGSENENKPYLFVKEYNKQGLKNFPIEISEGRLPQSRDELVLSEEIANNAKVDYKIGDQLSLEMGDRFLKTEGTQLSQMDPLQTMDGQANETLEIKQTKTYTIVGFMKRPKWEPMWSPGYTVISYVDEKLLSKQDTVDAIVILDKVNTSLYKHADELVAELKIEKVNFNNELLRFYGVTNNTNLSTTLYRLAAIIMAVIIVGSVSLIYNAFAISVSERSRHLGMLASVGATKRQKRNSVFFEGAVIGLISIPVGIASGLVGIGVTFWWINSYIVGSFGLTENFDLVVTPGSILVACLVSILTIFISTYVPARRASRVSAIDAIRQTQDIKLTGKTVKTSKLVRKIFGLEAEIGLKNLKRNKRRYQATVFSLVISIILFLSVSFFTYNLEKSLVLSQENINFDIQVMGGDEEELRGLTNLSYVTSRSLVHEVYGNTWIKESMVPHALQKSIELDPSILKEGKYPYHVSIYGLDEESFKKYALEVGADVEKLLDPTNKAAIVIEDISYQDGETGKIVESKSILAEPGQQLELLVKNYETEEEYKYSNIEIDTLTDKIPMGVNNTGIGVLDIVFSEETLKYLINGEDLDNEHQVQLFLNSSDPNRTQEDIEERKSGDMQVYNVQQNRQEEEQMIVLMSVFIYGFIVLISLISIANIFNTISTSISLRKREFAMLRSVGMTPSGFNKMIQYESIFYGLKALLYGLPISLGIMYLIHWSTRQTFVFEFSLPYLDIVFVVIALFVIVGSAMLYSISKIKKENIIDALKQENI
ncbi:putative ABC transport system permease protein [Bacillus mesophilus]|uniref:ABC transporter permease n=1 Tax=Bacillus mesophilus TaxID=1808955 RepID=A0A6M0QB45_9BACI|nr:ABC transporter permease [Bacillus mesophilus]MBM7662943.1 putative ABC transport system permease protein [Bacillus mesophilus]NEY73532.1 ABC transporter permease [Bacillus mesophilus]